MDVKNATDVAELLEVIGVGSLLPQLSEELTKLSERVNTHNKAGKVVLTIALKPHRQEDVLKADTTLMIEKPKLSGSNKDVTAYSDLLYIDPEEGLVLLSKSEISDLEE